MHNFHFSCVLIVLVLVLVLPFTYNDKLYVWRIPVLQFVIAVAHDVEEDPLRLNPKIIPKIRCDNFFPTAKWEMNFLIYNRDLVVHFFGCCCIFLCLRCVRTRLLFYILYFDRVKLFGVCAIHLQCVMCVFIIIIIIQVEFKNEQKKNQQKTDGVIYWIYMCSSQIS